MLKVTQWDVARCVEIDRTTVSKILNKYPKDSFDEATKQKVFKAAAQIGYLHPSVVKPQRRKARRKKSKASASIKVRLQDGSLCSECRGEVTNISSTGMLLRLLRDKQKLFSIPFDPFYLEISLTDSRLQVSKLKARPVRYTHNQNQLGLGVHFFDALEHKQLRKLVS